MDKKPIFFDVATDYQDEDYYYIDGWRKDQDQGQVLARVSKKTGFVEWETIEAMGNPNVIIEISKVIESGNIDFDYDF